MAVDFQQLAKVLAEAAAKADPAERAAFLTSACGTEAELRAEAERLLAAHERAGAFLETPVQPAEGRDAGAGAERNGDVPGSEAGIECAGARIAHYKLLEEIGEGAFGVVYMAEQVEPVQRRVALKIVKAGMDTREVVARFEAERQALALMDHPAIARVFDGGVTQTGRPYFVMELVQGISITEFCDQRKLATTERLRLFIEVCHAVQHAHQKGIIHRDLKPSNILVTLVDGRPVPKVIDFGVAKALGRKLTDKTLFTGFLRMVGTPAYMSPEQADLSGVDIDTRSDIYALGVILYELLTGVTPFDAETLRNASLDEIRRLIRETEPLKPSTRLHTLGERLTAVATHRQIEPAALSRLVRGDLDWIVMKCLDKDRGRRYETASSLAQDLQRHLGDEPIVARPPSRVYRVRKLVRRNKLVFAAGMAVALSLLIGLTLATVLFFRERIARRSADEQAAIAKAVNDFLQDDLLRQADSRAQAGARFKAEPNLTVREALERASQRIGDRFREEPLTELAIRVAIGDAFRGIGQEAQAVPHLLRALELSRAKLGPEHPGTLKCMDDLAAAYNDTGALDRALPLLEQSFRLRKARLGASHPDTLTSMHNLGDTYMDAGKLEQALVILPDTLRLRKATLGPEHPDTLKTMALVGVAQVYAGNLERALPLLEQTLELRKARLGPEHLDTLWSVNNLAPLYLEMGRLEQALPMFEETLKARRRILGENHPETLASKHNLGSAYIDAGKLDQAFPLVEEVFKTRVAMLGANHPHTLLTMNHLARACQEAGQCQKATALFDEAVQLGTGKLGPDHWITIRLMGNRACAYQAAGKLEEALRMHEETVRISRAIMGQNHPHTLKSQGYLGGAYTVCGLSEQGLQLLEETLKLERAGLGSRHQFTLMTMNNLALAYQGTGRLDRALPLFEETLKLSRENLGPDHRGTRRAMNDLAKAYMEAGDFGQAVTLFREALEWRRVRLGPEHPDTLMSLTNVTNCLLQQSNHSNAAAPGKPKAK